MNRNWSRNSEESLLALHVLISLCSKNIVSDGERVILAWARGTMRNNTNRSDNDSKTNNLGKMKTMNCIMEFVGSRKVNFVSSNIECGACLERFGKLIYNGVEV